MTVLVAAPGLRRPSRGVLVGAVLAAWLLLFVALRGQFTLSAGGPTVVPTWLQHLKDGADGQRNTSPLFLYGFNEIRVAIDPLFTNVQGFFLRLGWLGCTVLAAALGLVFAGWRMMLLALAGFLAFGVLGLFGESMDTLALTLTSVLIALVIGIPLGIVAGNSDRFQQVLTPVLDLMQILPTFAYLPLITLCFLIGPASAVIATVIYAAPPVIRLTSAGIRNVAPATTEASRSLGATRWQTVRHVQLPMAKRTIVLGINQTMMAALSMATITALIDAPGLGKTVLKALSREDVGAAFDAGLCIVILAVVLDRVTTAASQRAADIGRSGRATSVTARPAIALLALVAVVVAAQLPRLTARVSLLFPDGWVHPIRPAVNTASRWIELHLFSTTEAIKNGVTYRLINPLQTLLGDSPWWLLVLVVAALGYVLSGVRIALAAAGCLVGLALLGLWPSGMITLASTLVGAVSAMVIGVVVGVWTGRNDLADRILRPFLDAGQTMPAFVYLIPGLALFGATRFTGIVAGVIYASPVVIKVVNEGIRDVSPSTIEAAVASGSTPWQVITKVQLPMARPHLLLAFNQGVIYVLAAVIVAGLVGGGGLGLDVINGFSQVSLAGTGLAAGIGIVLLGIMLDRITQGAGRRRAGSDVALGAH